MDGQQPARTGERLTAGQVAERFGVTVRTLHHYDDVGLLRPSERSAGGYRLYTEEDLLRLRHVVVYRRLGLPLERIEELLAAEEPGAVLAHLRRQRESVLSRLAGLPATSAEAMDAAEAARRQIHDRFYDLSPESHRALGDMYVADPRSTRTYEDLAPGLAQYVRDAIQANADRAGD
ncbi:MerR family transcriptional regulator [Kocuria turfanensis]|nr:MerR family transcriptional regulator [Kocuria turfanensis]